ncbi:hypothetical protein [Rubritalea tangerina]|uniref:hypothetical protein n=1 Tax=Rubritalea tangerina TaxID=430798 RepID=UPI003607298C
MPNKLQRFLPEIKQDDSPTLPIRSCQTITIPSPEQINKAQLATPHFSLSSLFPCNKRHP